jgi:hypothetical protein
MRTAAPAFAAALALGITVPATSAPAATKKASLAGSIGVTAPSNGQALVRAISLANRSIVAGRLLPNNGAFKLALPAGSYLVVGTVLSDTSTVTKRIAVTLKAGQRRTKAKLTAKARKKKAGARARAAYTTEHGSGRKGVSAVGVNPFSGPPESAGELHYLAQGAADLVTVDLVNDVAKRCPSKVLVHEVNPEIIKALRAEAALGRSPYADRSSFPPAHRIVSNVRVDGVISGEGTAATSTLTVKDASTGETVATLTEPLGDDPFAALSKQTSDLTEILCARVGGYDLKLDLRATATSAFNYTATARFSGTLIAEQDTSTHWSGSAAFQRTAPTFTPSDSCSIFDPVTPPITWSAEINAQGANQISVYWSTAGDDHVTATRDCPPAGPNAYDPPPDPRTPGVSIGSPAPLSFTLPKTGGTTSITGESFDGALTGTLTVRKVKTP